MGFLSDNELEFEGEQSDPDTPPGSPRLAATHAQAIAEKSTTGSLEINSRTLRDYASLCCEELGLTDMDKDDVMKTSQMPAHLIAIRQYTRTVALTHNINQLLTESFLESTEFKDHIVRRIQATFLDADLPTYVRGCTARLIQHMQENPASWRIPSIVHSHFIHSKAFRKAVAATASNFRGDMRRKIKKSIMDSSDIGAFAKRLCVKGYQPTVGHWRRFALLRSYMRDWENIPVKPGKGRNISFWAFIDTKLDKLRNQCSKPTEEATEKAMKDKLKGNLKDDQRRYKGPASGTTKLPARVHLPEWQKDHAKAVQEMLSYAVQFSPDDDIDDDDSATENPDPQVSLDDGLALDDREHDGDAEGDLGSEPTHIRPPTLDVHAPETPTGQILVPDTQETMPGIPGSSLHTQTGGSGSAEGSQASFIPETQLRSNESYPRRTEDNQGSYPSGSAPRQPNQAGQTAATLVMRRPRTSYRTTSPIARPS